MKQKYLILFSLTGLIICLDQLTKMLVRSNLDSGIEIPWTSWMSICHHRSYGAAFSFIQKLPPAFQNLVFIAIPVFALFLIVLIFIKLQDDQMLTSLALTTILGGALGNMIDRFEFGAVLDIFRFQMGDNKSTAFNLADLAILIGVGIVFLNTLIQNRRGQQI